MVVVLLPHPVSAKLLVSLHIPKSPFQEEENNTISIPPLVLCNRQWLTLDPAGTSLTVEMHAQPGARSCSQPAIGGNHYGPVLIYMAKVSDAKTATSGSFFKVAEDGYTGTTASWGTEILNANCGKRSFTVPKSLAAGDYLVRAEAIALHAGAGSPQPYVSCFQVKVTGGGSATPSGVSFPGAYKISDPLFSKAIYDSSFKYVSPGPAVYSG